MLSPDQYHIDWQLELTIDAEKLSSRFVLQLSVQESTHYCEKPCLGQNLYSFVRVRVVRILFRLENGSNLCSFLLRLVSQSHAVSLGCCLALISNKYIDN